MKKRKQTGHDPEHRQLQLTLELPVATHAGPTAQVLQFPKKKVNRDIEMALQTLLKEARELAW